MRGFRHLADAELELPEPGCVIVGRNGHGKTSLIEALVYPEVFRSFRGAADRELVRFGADGFHLEAQVDAGEHTPGGPDRRAVTVGYDARTRQKKVTVDGAEPARLGDAIGLVRGVVLSPGDVVLVSGGPRERRRYLDVLLALTVRGYIEALTKYRRALAQRARATVAEMAAWEQVLGDSGAAIITARQAWVESWRGAWSGCCSAIGEVGAPSLEYAAQTPGGAETLRAAFAASRERDRSLGRSSVGPHRDDLRLTLDGRALRTYGSAGQQRTAALALRLIEADGIARTGGTLLCLDDAFAELDAGRSSRLGELIEERARAGQRIVAAVPKDGDVPAVIRSLPRWTITDGQVRTA